MTTTYVRVQPDKLTQAINSAPPSSLSRIVFLWSRNEKRFNTLEFNPSGTMGRLTQADVDRVLDQIYQLKSV